MNAQNTVNEFAQDSSNTFPFTIMLRDTITVCYTLEQEMFMIKERLKYNNVKEDLSNCIVENIHLDEYNGELLNQHYRDGELHKEMQNSITILESEIESWKNLNNNSDALNDVLRKERKKYKIQRDIIIVGGVVVTVGLGSLLIWAIIN